MLCHNSSKKSPFLLVVGFVSHALFEWVYMYTVHTQECGVNVGMYRGQRMTNVECLPQLISTLIEAEFLSLKSKFAN